MKNIFPMTYKIEFGSVIYLNFQFVGLMVTETMENEFPNALKVIMIRDFDVEVFIKLLEKIDAKEDHHEKTGSDEILILEVTENEICNFLCLAILVSKILDSKYFIFIKNKLTIWNKMISKDISPDSMDEFGRKLSTIEGFSEIFENDVRVLARLAKIRFINNPDFINKIESAFDYEL